MQEAKIPSVDLESVETPAIVKVDSKLDLNVNKVEVIECTDKTSRKLAKSDLLYDKKEKIVQFTPDNEDTTHPSQYNFKVPIQVNGDAFVNAELDSDSHISLISDKYFEKLLKFD